LSGHATPGGATEQYCHARGSGVTVFSTSKTPSNVADVATLMPVARQRYLVAAAALARPKELNSQKKLGAIIIKILNKIGLNNKNFPHVYRVPYAQRRQMVGGQRNTYHVQ
jgi:hypothetical protein